MKDNCYVGKLDFKQNVRLLLLTPLAPIDGNEGPFSLVSKEHLLLASTHVDEIYCSDAPLSLEKIGDCEKAVPFVVEKTKWAELQGYDAVVVNCMLDPGVLEAKRAVDITVIGLREANLAMASLIGKHPANIFTQNIPVIELSTDEEKTFHQLIKAGRQRIAKQGADVLIPNCAFLGGLAQRLQEELCVPVLPNRDIGLKLAELLVTFNIRPNKYSSLQEGFKYKQRPRFQKFLSRVGSLVKKFIRIMRSSDRH